jgi:sulfatase modifying factor 1
MMNAKQQKVIIKLTDVGYRQDKILAVLSKIQGLTDTPESLVANAPCDISGKIPIAVAEQVKSYLEKAGATVELEAPDMSGQTLSPSSETQNSLPIASAESSKYHLTPLTDQQDSALYEVTETDVLDSDITYFESDALPHTQATEQSSTEKARTSLSSVPSPVKTAQRMETFLEDEPPPEPQPRKRHRRKAKRAGFSPVLVGTALILAVILGVVVWTRFSGKFSHLAQQQATSVVGSAGVLEIENEANAELTLHHVLGTRVTEEIPLTGTSAALKRGDYYVEARQNAQILRFPVYIAERGHRVRVSIATFPDQTKIPDNLVYIPEGWFRMGNKETDVVQFGFPDEKPDIDVYVGAFLINKYEVTNQEYAKFVEAGGYEKEAYWEALIQDWNDLIAQVPQYGQLYGNDGWKSVSKYIHKSFINTDNLPGPRLWEKDEPPYEYAQDEYPVVGITLYEAEAYCQWWSQRTGKVYRLPTEAEWEKAARGPEGYFFSYGNEYDPTRANTETQGPIRVGYFPPNGYGAYDLTGNVWEWIADQYRADAYQYLLKQYKTEIRNPKIFDEAKRYNRRIVRGGSFRSVNRINAKTTIRYPMFPNYWHTNIGFRYVTTP